MSAVELKLDGATVVLTRRREDVSALVQRIEAAGGEAVCAPMIDFAAPADPAPLLAARAELETYDWLVLTSRYAARALLEEIPPPGENRPQVAALGQSTARVIEGLGWPVDVDGGGAGADTLAEQLAASQALQGKRLLYPKSSLARSKLPATLLAAGADVVEVEAYQTLPPRGEARETVLAQLELEGALFLFASPSAVKHLDQVLAERRGEADPARAKTWTSIPCISIGPTTSAALRKLGVDVLFEASQPDDDGLLAALVEARGGQQQQHKE